MMDLPKYNLIRYELDTLILSKDISNYFHSLVKRYNGRYKDLYDWFGSLTEEQLCNIGISVREVRINNQPPKVAGYRFRYNSTDRDSWIWRSIIFKRLTQAGITTYHSWYDPIAWDADDDIVTTATDHV